MDQETDFWQSAAVCSRNQLRERTDLCVELAQAVRLLLVACGAKDGQRREATTAGLAALEKARRANIIR